jgi:hypothetical protein
MRLWEFMVRLVRIHDATVGIHDTTGKDSKYDLVRSHDTTGKTLTPEKHAI